MILNKSRNKEYRSQRDTKRRPSSACNVTVAVMGIVQSGNRIETLHGIMPEDYLMDLLGTDEAWNLLNTVMPGSVINPWNTSYCIAWAVNKAIGRRICKVEKVTLPEIVHHLSEGGAVGVGGRFTKSGHFVSIAGIESDQDLSVITNPSEVDITRINNIIIDDPWGDYRTGYKNHNGNDIILPVKDFLNITFGKDKVKTVQMYYKTSDE